MSRGDARVVVRRAGLTLLELVVAVTVTGLALGGGYAALTTMADNQRRALAAARAAARAAAVRRTLDAWLGGARLTIEEDAAIFRGLDGVGGAGDPADELTFLTTAPAAPGAGESVVRLYVDTLDATPERGLVAEVAEWRAGAAAPVREVVELLPEARGLELRYLSGVGGGGRRWLSSWISTSVLPAAVYVAPVAAPGDSLPPLLARPLIVPLAGRW